MRTLASVLRLVAVAMVVVLAITVATPEPAHADALAAVGIAVLVVCGVIVAAYLIAATASERRGEAEPIVVASAFPASPASAIVAIETP